ncbi:DEAD/DEAH box helicase [Microterricola viridarii]|uniref:Superfamily II DNA or RNA helicase, SNF2 family n=1 Tax=Microterricola viridarii TaxID=412690 RepID=A0A1H1Y0Q2_9MICO|nr:DEAD/DEAH box helicase [Microterricola viridarii]SDT15064.1 Superfamily II DNA or RNA helicase, SNF2 family [Microterricola viridarii]
MLAPTYPLVDVGDIIRLVGRGLYERGRGRARDGSVSGVVWHEMTETLTGVVTDAGADPFEITVRIEPTTRGFGTPFASGCGCPLGGDCAHVAAVILNANGEAARRKTTEPAERPEPVADDGRSNASTSADGWWPSDVEPTDDSAVASDDELPPWASEPDNREAAGARSPGIANRVSPNSPRPPALPAWKQALGPIAQPPGDARLRSDEEGAPTGSRTGTARVAAGPTRMGLQFELREPTRRSSTPWGAQSWRGGARPPRPSFGGPSSRGGARQSAQLMVRPVLHNERGNWVRSGISWGTLSYQSNRLNLDTAQHRWFCEFGALYRASRFTYTGEDADWIILDEFASPLLWRLLERATELDIPLLGASKTLSVRLAGQAGLSLDATKPDAGLLLSPVLTVDGAAHPTGRAAAIGEHGVYLREVAEIVEPVRYGRRTAAQKVADALAANENAAGSAADKASTQHTTITLAPLDAPLTAELRALLGQPEPLAVAPDEVAEFLEGYYPQLRRRIAVTSSDDSVELPALQRPTLVLTAMFRPKHVLVLAWNWEYLDGREPGDDAEAEAEIAERLYDETHQEIEEQHRQLQGIDAAEFCAGVLPRIERIDGVRVDVQGTRPDYRELTEDPELTISTVESDQTDWFDLGVVVTVGGRKVPFGPLFQAMAKDRKKLLLIDNSYLSLEHPALDRLRVLIAEAKALSEWETGLRISRYQTSLWADFEDLADHTEQAQSWRESVAGLNAIDSLEQTPVPDAVAATLRPYQLDGYNWLAFLWRHKLGGVLADDMGLGKTLQTLALFAHAVEQKPAGQRQPFLVVAPTSVVSNWAAEAARFTPGLTVRTVKTTQAKGTQTLAELAAGADVLITSYALFRLDEAAYGALEWAGLVLDEAQFVKNHKARAHQVAKEFAAPFKLAITGTPMENNLLELWSMFSITAPGLFPSARKFTETYVRRLEKGVDKAENRELLATLRRRIRPLMMRRTKELVAPELPAKHEQTLAIDLEPRHAKLYETMLQRERAKLFGLIDDMNKNRFIVFRSLTLLRMLSLDASLVDPKYAHIPSSKLDALLEQLEDVVAEGHRALVFSQFTGFLQKAAARLEERGIAYAYLDGSTTKRDEAIDGFKRGDAPVFLVSLKAGGFGLNLTEADYVFLLDPWWNPASEAQAVDRAHRIGQTKNVMVYRMVATGTIEEKVMALKEAKARVFSAVLDDDAAFSAALTADDIRGLLA